MLEQRSVICKVGRWLANTDSGFVISFYICRRFILCFYQFITFLLGDWGDGSVDKHACCNLKEDVSSNPKHLHKSCP